MALGEHYRVQGNVAQARRGARSCRPVALWQGAVREAADANPPLPQVLAATRDSSSVPSLEFRGHSGSVTALTHSGSLYMSGSADQSARVYNSSGELRCAFSGQNGTVNAVALSSAFGLAITGSSDGWLRLYNTSSCNFLARLRGPHTAAITAIATNDPSTPGAGTN